MNYEQCKKDFIKLMEKASGRHNTYKVFTDFCLMSALAFAQVSHFDEEREKRYLEIIGEYTKEEQTIFPQMLAEVTKAFECKWGDFLGEIYMDCGFGSSNQGQFFTPYSICKLMAQMTTPNPEKDKIITVSDCCVGGGALIIAFAENLAEKEVNFQMNMLADVMDISQNSCAMCMVQFSLLGIPCIVTRGNSLTLEKWEVWETPMVAINLVQERLNNQRAREKMPEVVEVAQEITAEKEEIKEPENVIKETKSPVDVDFEEIKETFKEGFLFSEEEMASCKR